MILRRTQASEPAPIVGVDVVLGDLDGVVYAGPGPIPHAVESLNRAASDGVRLGFITNNAARTDATVAAHLTDLGLEVAPADVHVVMAGKSAEIADTAELIAAGLDASGVGVILDDRNASVGVKFADAELLGVPTICVVGRGVANGVVEVRDRATGEKTEVSLAEVVEHLRAVASPRHPS